MRNKAIEIFAEVLEDIGERMMAREEHTTWPDLEHYPDIPVFNTKAVVQQTGVPAPTLRAWERRYAILSPERGNNSYRLYSARDIATIRWLKQRVDAGMSISQAIALLRHLEEERRQLRQLQEDISSPEITPPFQVALPSININEQAPEGIEQVEEAEVQDLSSPAQTEVSAPQPPISKWFGTNIEKGLNNYPAIHNMRIVQEHLLEAFKVLDESTPAALMASMLAIYSIEQVCAELIRPTLWQIGTLWQEGQISVAVEHFASAFFRGLLMNLLHVTPNPITGPLAIACCAPGEAHEIAPLMLSLLLRRAGVRVAYLGQSIEIAGLLQTIRQLSPSLICVSISIPSFLDGLTDLGRLIQETPSPHPIFAFGGQLFEQCPQCISQVPGQYVSGDLYSIVAQLKDMALEQS